MDKDIGVVGFLLLFCSCLADTAIDCGMNEKLENNNCVPCPQCPIGTGLAERCGFGSGAYLACEPCPEGFYNDSPTDSVCIPCTDCTMYKRRTKYECRVVINAECGECLDGYYDDGKNLLHRSELYSCKPCPADECGSSAAPPEGINRSDDVRRPWKITTAVLLPLCLLVFVFCLFLMCKRGSPVQQRTCRGLAETLAGFCLKRSAHIIRRGQGRRTTDEENLCAVGGVCVQGDAFARDPEARPASAPEEEIAELCESRSSPQDDTNGQDDEVPEPVVSVTIEQNTDYENQKSISRKTKAIPPPASPLGDGSWRLDGMSNFRNVFSDAAIGGRTSSGEEHGAHFDEESLSDGNPTEETSEMNPDPALDADDQDCLAELGTPPEQSAFDEDAAYSEASTVLIRGRAQTARSWPSDVGRSLPLRRDPQRQQLGEIPEEDVQNPVIGRRDCVIELRSKDDDADGSRNRHPRNGQTTSYRECRDGSAGRSDDHLLRTSANGSPNVGTVNIIKAGGNGGHLMVNNGGISIQVFNCLPRDGEGLGNKASSGDLLIDDPSVPSSFTCDSEETHVKRPVYGPLPAFATGCRPRNERSFPSFTHFPVQETCDGPPLSASSFK